MMKCIMVLVTTKKVKKTWGNHSMYKPAFGTYPIKRDFAKDYIDVKCTRAFLYHGNAICLVDDVERLMYLSHAGWFTSSTNRALNAYRTHFVSLGYEDVWHTKIYAHEK